MPPSKQRASKARKSSKTAMRQKMANMTAKRLASNLCALESLTATNDTLEVQRSTEPVPPASLSPTPTQPSCSASKRKLSLFTPQSAPAAELPKTITDLSNNCMIAQLYSPALCPQCKTASLHLVEVKHRNRAYAVFLELRCTLCEDTISESYTSKQTKTDQSMDTNRRAVLTGLTVGLGHAGIMKLFEGLGMPSMHGKTWRTHFSVIARQTNAIKKNYLDQAREKVVDYYRRTEPDAFDENGILNIGVSFDGSMAKRGFTSKLGAGAVIEIMTGLIIDFHVMSSHCQLCLTVGESLRQSKDKGYDEWLRCHLETGMCTKNHEGTAGYMEICGAMTMWGRSLSHGMRYTTFLGDGDAKTITALNKANFYGSIMVVKEECVNHVSKRLNAGLRKLVTTMSKQNVQIGGHKKGSLTAVKIGLLQSYYTTAVRTFNTSTDVMSKAIWAAFYHSISTAEDPQHGNCPEGEESWCWYQRALVDGPVDPAQHEDHDTATFLNSTVATHVKKVYERLTDPALLGRCLLGKTQNTNESLHSVIWAKCPKHTFSGLNRVKFGATVAVGEYNMGSLGSHLFFPAVGCALTSATTSLGHKRDKRRIYKADISHQAPAKKRRELREAAQQRAQHAATRDEGGPSYVPGGF